MADPVIGSLYLSPTRAYPVPQQPGGPNTPVTQPTQPPTPQSVAPFPIYVGEPNEHQGRFFPGCGHSINQWDIVRAAVAGVPSALVCCPICGFIQNIYTPYTLLDEQDIIFG